MQFVPNGPDVPDRLIQAHEEGRVVFFCGAGISCPAGLPTFRELVEKLFEAVGNPPDEVEAAALSKGELDRALGHYESRVQGGRRAVRRHLPELLKLDLTRRGALRTHQALLTLARSRGDQRRLVTTNFDRLFEEVIKQDNLPVERFRAPLLPIPKNSWDGLVYLHGLLPEQPTNADLERLVLSSGDFGLAYLTERWAARFISELFQKFTVCFVGYSINDPILRYMVDALAADRLRGELAGEMFSFAACSKGKEQDARAEWEAKNVTPILYRMHSRHAYLHRTLEEWAGIYRDGIAGKEQVITRYARNQPLRGQQQDNFVGRVLWALSDPSGLPARRFAELEPAPPFEWLEVLADKRFGHEDLARFRVPPLPEVQEKRLLRWRPPPEIRFSLLERPAPYPLAPNMALVSDGDATGKLDEVMGHLGLWLLNYLDEPGLILWLAEQGGQLHPDFARQVHWRLEDIAKWEHVKANASSARERQQAEAELDHLSRRSPQAIPRREMRILWRLMLLGRIHRPRSELAVHQWFEQLQQHGLSPSLRMEFRQYLEPCIRLTCSWGTSLGLPNDKGWGNLGLDCHVEPAHADITTQLRAWKGTKAWEEALPGLLEDATALLWDHLELIRELGQDTSFRANFSLSQDYADTHSISDWWTVALLARDAWLATAKQDRSHARRVAEKWWVLRHPLFRRQALFAAAQDEVIPPQTALDWLAAENGRWLWEDETEREILDLLKVLPKRLDAAQLSGLEQLLLAGPPPDFISKSGLDPQTIERRVLTRLRALQDAGVSLSQAARERLENSQAIPGLEPPPVPSGAYVVSPERVPRRRRDLVEWLRHKATEQDRPYDDWADYCKKKFATPACALIALANQGEWLPERWASALSAWATKKHRKLSWRWLAPWLMKAPDDALQQMAGGLSVWLIEVAKTLDRDEDLFFELCQRLLDLDYPKYATVSDSKDLQTAAINHPVGRVTEALLNWWDQKEPSLLAGQGAHAKLKPIFTRLCDTKKADYRWGRIVLAMRVLPLFHVDPEWTRRHLLPLFNWKGGLDPKEVLGAWMGFLVAPDFSPDFLKAIKQPLLETVSHYNELDRYKEQYARLLTVVALEAVDTARPSAIFSADELGRAFRVLPVEGLEQAAAHLVEFMEAAGNEREVLWDRRVKPLLQKNWPKTKDKFTPKISARLARLFIATGSRFPEAMQEFGHWLTPVSFPLMERIAKRLFEADHCRKYPETSLDLLDKIVDENQPLWTGCFQEYLDAIAKAAPNLSGDPRLTRLSEYCRRNA